MYGVDKPFQQPHMQSPQSHFSQVPQANIPRSVFDRTHQHKTTFNAGDLIPIYVDEVLPGDSFKMRTTTYARLATPIKPFMDNLYADIFFFFVPNRLVWDNWEKFNGAQDNPGDSTDFLIPVVTTPGGGYTYDSLFAYFGARQLIGSMPNMNALHSRAYNLIWNQWFRDENLQNSITVDKGNGPDTDTNYIVRKRGKRHDYFTSALPFTQKGPAVTIPMAGNAPVMGLGKLNNTFDSGANTLYYSNKTSIAVGANTTRGIDNSNDGALYVTKQVSGGVNYPNIYADLSGVTAATINALRQAFQIQRMYERDARGGTRYIEILKSHFGVTSPDFRLQRAEYLGGGSTPITTAPIPQTSDTSGTSPQGNLAAMGSFSHSGVGFNKSFVEHGVILGLISVRADLTYQQGLNRMWSRQTRFDYYWPALSHLGEQSVLNQELYVQGNANDVAVFGYQERYAEYRYKPSNVTGKFNSDYATPLDMWHLAQKFTSLPTLGDTFIKETPPMSRIKAVTSEPDFLLDCLFDLKCARPMPVYSVPGLIDHF